MDCKGQGALEYLLIVAGAVLIAAIVISLLATFGAESKNEAEFSRHVIRNRSAILRHKISPAPI